MDLSVHNSEATWRSDHFRLVSNPIKSNQMETNRTEPNRIRTYRISSNGNKSKRIESNLTISNIFLRLLARKREPKREFHRNVNIVFEKMRYSLNFIKVFEFGFLYSILIHIFVVLQFLHFFDNWNVKTPLLS